MSSKKEIALLPLIEVYHGLLTQCYKPGYTTSDFSVARTNRISWHDPCKTFYIHISTMDLYITWRAVSAICAQVAVKVIDKKKAREDAYVCRNMRRESRLLQQIRHRHIIQLFEVRLYDTVSRSCICCACAGEQDTML